MPETVLIVSNLYPPNIVGGAELIAHYQAKELQKAGCRVHVFAGEGHAVMARYAISSGLYDGIPVERIHLSSQDFSPESLNFFHTEIEARFLDTLDRIQPDVVHIHNLIGLSAGVISLAARRSIPVIITLHDHWGFCLRNTLITPDNQICRDFSRCAECQPSISGTGDLNLPIRMRNDYLFIQMQYVSAFVFPSQYLASVYAKAGFPKELLHVLWNGVDVARFARVQKRPDPAKVRFTFIGYMGEHKGLNVLFDALALIGRDARFQINLVGDGHLRASLEKRVQECGMSDQVRFWGKVSHNSIERVLEQTDVQLMPSIWPENQPVSITEAMATRTAVIASRVGGIPELVEEGRSGLLFEPGNAAQLAEKMLNLVDRPALVKEFGENGFIRIQDASLERQVGQLLELYRRAVPIRDVRTSRSLIVCCGPRFDSRTYRAVEEISSRFGFHQHAFTMHDWIASDQLQNAKAALVLPGADFKEIRALMGYRLPLVIPAEMTVLMDLCRKERCGLYYETAEEAAECLLWLLENPHDQVLLAENSLLASGALGDRALESMQTS